MRRLIVFVRDWPPALKLGEFLLLTGLLIKIIGYDSLGNIVAIPAICILTVWMCLTQKAALRNDRYLDAKWNKELCLGQDWQYDCEYYYEERGVPLCGRPEDAHFCIPEEADAR